MSGTAVLLFEGTFNRTTDNTYGTNIDTYHVITDKVDDDPFVGIVGLPAYKELHPYWVNGPFPLRAEEFTCQVLASYYHADTDTYGLQYLVKVKYDTHGRKKRFLARSETDHRAITCSSRTNSINIPGFRKEPTIIPGADIPKNQIFLDVWQPYPQNKACIDSLRIYSRTIEGVDEKTSLKILAQMNKVHYLDDDNSRDWLLEQAVLALREGETQFGVMVGRWSVEYTFVTREPVDPFTFDDPEDLNSFLFPDKPLGINEQFIVRPVKNVLDPKEKPEFTKIKNFEKSGIGKDGLGWKTLPGI